MTRNEYIARQREQHQRRAVAVLPVHYPKEIFTALDLLAVELWGPPGPPRGDAAGRVQTYVCAVARNALAFMASGRADAVDAVLFPHTCDSIQGLATLAPDFGGWSKKAFTFLHPKGESRRSSRTFLLAELKKLGGDMAAWAGRPLDDERLRAAIVLHRRIDRARASLLDARARVPMSDVALYTLLRRGEWLWPEEHLAELEAAGKRIEDGPVQKGVPLLITGYVPEPLTLLETLGDAGAYVAADDYAAIGRRVVREADSAVADPWAALAQRAWAAPPCPTRAADQSIRMRHLSDMLVRSGAKGVLVHTVKFCEPELFDVPAIHRTFQARNVPVLSLEGELEMQLSGQTVTRVEAFVEMLTSGRAA